MTLAGFWERFVLKKRYIMQYHAVNGTTPHVSSSPMLDLDIDALLDEADDRLATYLKMRKSDPSWVFFEYREEGVRMGYSFLHVPSQEEWNDSLPTRPGEARIGSSFVYPEFRGRGIRGEMFKKQYQYSAEKSLKLWAVIEKSNYSSIKAASKTGKFERVNYLLKIYGRNVFSTLSRPVEVHLLWGRKRERR